MNLEWWRRLILCYSIQGGNVLIAKEASDKTNGWAFVLNDSYVINKRSSANATTEQLCLIIIIIIIILI